MTRVFFLLLISSFSCVYAFGQKRPESGIEIKNTLVDLNQNRVLSISFSDHYYKDQMKKELYEEGRRLKTEIFDSLGRKVEVIYFDDTTAQFAGRVKYFYADTIGVAIYRIEQYNELDSITSIQSAEMRNEQMLYIRIGDGVSCFGNYKFVYNGKGLIQEAIWYGPKKGIWANENMIPYYTTKLKYTYRP